MNPDGIIRVGKLELPNIESSPEDKLRFFHELSSKFSLIRLNGKRPIEKGWQKYCHDRREFEEIGFRSDDNAGIACGPASGILVLDIDNAEIFDKVTSDNGWKIPSTYSVQTGSGNLHHYFQYPQDGKRYGNKAFKKLGFDIRGMGGVIVAPGSLHPDTGEPYTISMNAPIADPPNWFLELCNGARTADCGHDNDTSSVANVDVNLLPISEKAKRLIIGSSPVGQRSEAIMSVVNSLINADVESAKIFGIFDHYPIGEKYREKGHSKREWLNAHIEKAKESKLRPAIRAVQTFTAKELDEEDICPPDWIIERLLPVGLTLLAGAPKAGKTRLVTQMALGLSTGESIFGKIEVEKCSVLCLFLEDSKWRIKERLSAQRDGDLPQNLHLAHKWPRVEEGGLDALDRWLTQHRDVRAVIIDILGKFTSLSSSKNIYQGDYNKIEKIKALADRHAIAIIVVHHLNKLKESPDVFDKISGSTGLTGASDTVAVLERYNRAGTDAKLYIAGRDVEAAELPLSYDSQAGVWLYAGDAKKYCSTEERIEIFELLEELGKPMKSKEIAEALGKNHNTVRGLLTRMIKKGELKQAGRGKYTIP